MRQRLLIILCVVFFLGFPMAGLVFVWKYAHANIERSAAPIGKEIALDVLSDWDGKFLDEVGTLAFRQSQGREVFERQKASLGAFVSLKEDWKQEKTAVGQRDDAIWQVVRFTGTAEYKMGRAELRMAIARRTMNPEWRVDEFQLIPMPR